MKILDLNLDNYDALVFDLDGTLVDSMPYHNKAWIDTFASFGVQITEDFLFSTAGMGSERLIALVAEKKGITLNIEEVSNKKREMYNQMMPKVDLLAPMMDVVKHYYKKKTMAIVTGGSHTTVDVLLPKLGIEHYFDSIVCADDTKLGKDSVEPYLLAEKQLSVDITKCVFFDDGDVGLEGAKKAGMTVVHVDSHKEEFFIAVK
ncbi:MAG: HAD-IA family hydrolase [Bdellovibrionota bacterium]|nr:HAD-IA family hydrolase [Bdellovibrionota bacterium]